VGRSREERFVLVKAVVVVVVVVLLVREAVEITVAVGLERKRTPSIARCA